MLWLCLAKVLIFCTVLACWYLTYCGWIRATVWHDLMVWFVLEDRFAQTVCLLLVDLYLLTFQPEKALHLLAMLEKLTVQGNNKNGKMEVSGGLLPVVLCALSNLLLMSQCALKYTSCGSVYSCKSRLCIHAFGSLYCHAYWSLHTAKYANVGYAQSSLNLGTYPLDMKLHLHVYWAHSSNFLKYL